MGDVGRGALESEQSLAFLLHSGIQRVEEKPSAGE